MTAELLLYVALPVVVVSLIGWLAARTGFPRGGIAGMSALCLALAVTALWGLISFASEPVGPDRGFVFLFTVYFSLAADGGVVAASLTARRIRNSTMGT